MLKRKFSIPWQDIRLALKELEEGYTVITNTPETIQLATQLAEKYHYSFYDSLVLAAALKADCQIVYSEDMQNQQIIEGKLRIVNPFRDL